MTQPPKTHDPGRPQLRVLLEQLLEELRSAQSPDPDTRRFLEELQTETAALLERDETGGAGHGRLRERLMAEAARVEGTHPDLAMAMAKVIDILSGLGI
jgi:hypothetical protein